MISEILADIYSCSYHSSAAYEGTDRRLPSSSDLQTSSLENPSTIPAEGAVSTGEHEP